MLPFGPTVNEATNHSALTILISIARVEVKRVREFEIPYKLFFIGGTLGENIRCY